MTIHIYRPHLDMVESLAEHSITAERIAFVLEKAGREVRIHEVVPADAPAECVMAADTDDDDLWLGFFVKLIESPRTIRHILSKGVQ